MKRFIRKQWSTNRVVRKVIFWLHPKIHPGIHLPTSFQMSGGCVLCRVSAWSMAPLLNRPESLDALADESQIVAQEETDTHRKIVMSATVKRQIEEITASDPEKAKALAEALEQIARKP